MSSGDYLEHLKTLLGRSLNATRTEELVDEIASHLHLATQGKVANGVSQEAAIAESIRELGSADILAEDLIRRESGVDTKSVWRLALLPMSVLILYSLATWVFSSRLVGLVGMDLMEYSILLLFATAVWRSRRWLVVPMAVVSICIPLVLTLLLVNQPVRPWVGGSQEAAVAHYDRQITQHRIDIAKAEKALAGNLAAVKEGAQYYRIPQPVENTQTLHVPFLPFALSMPSEHRYSWMTTTSREQAELAWRAHGGGYMGQIRDGLAQATESRQRIVSGNNGITFAEFVRTSLSFLLIGIASQIGVFAFVNAVVLLMLSRRRRLRSRAPLSKA